jgi:hypothetical protein
MRFLIAVILFSVVPFVSNGSTCDLKAVEKVNRLLKRDKQVLILAWSDKDKCGDEDETCGDWAARLNQFKSGQGKTFEIVNIAPKKWNQVVTLPSTDIPRHSALFLFKGHPSYFYKGVILEFDVYRAVLDSWKGISSESKDFLPEKVDVRMCK